MTTTTNRGYSTPATGTQNGIWGSDDLNPNFTLIDKNLGGVASVALTNSNVTLSSSEYANGTIKFTGTLAANVTVTFPTVSGWWTVINNCSAANTYYIRLSCSVGGLKICPPPGEAIDIYCDATDVGYRNLGHAIGSYWDYAGASVPVWVSGCSVPPYLLCDGSTYSAVTYPQLNAILGTTTLVDTRGRGRFNLNGGQSRITTAGSGIDGDTRFSAGGAQNTTLVDTNMVPHTHTQEAQQPTFNVTTNSISVAGGTDSFVRSVAATGGGTTVTTVADATPGTTGSYGGSGGAAQPFYNMPPAYIGGITMIRAA
jgi:microcystin-dependent protein